jgi:MSHA pilin protein MshD
MLGSTKQSGFSLIEAVMFIVVVGIALAVIVMQFRQNVGHSHEPYIRQRGMAVMNAYMDEIVRKRWNECTPIGGGQIDTGAGLCPDGSPIPGIGSDGENRSQFDDVDDYNGISDSPPQFPDQSDPVDGQSPMPDYSGFTATVSVTQPGGAWNGVPAADVRHITVTVTTPADEDLTIHAYRLNF